MAPKDPYPQVLAYDLGGTKVAVGVVDSRGKVLEQIREPVRTGDGKAAVLRQLSDLGKQLLARHPRIRRAGIASAGPLDPRRGTLIDPTNLSAGGKSWGVVPIARILSKNLGIPVTLENDAAAAMLAEHWVGAAKRYRNAMILTLGTGLGTGVIANGALVRAGHGLHPEGGHIIINHDDQTAPCNCGNFGCAEAYLSGMHFTRRARIALKRPEIQAIDVAELARKGNRAARRLFDEYSNAMSAAIATYAVIYCPEIVVFTGSFANTSDLFLEPTRRRLEHRLRRRRKGTDLMPKLVRSKLSNDAGLIGGAYVAIHPHGND